MERFKGGDEEGEREGGVGWLVKKVLSLGCWDCQGLKVCFRLGPELQPGLQPLVLVGGINRD